MTNKLAMRRRLDEAGVPQPRFAPLRTPAEARRAADEVGFPAVVKPADASGQHGVARVVRVDEVAARLPAALAASPTGEALIEEFVEGDGDERDRGLRGRRGAVRDALRPAAPRRARASASAGSTSTRRASRAPQLVEAERVAVDAAGRSGSRRDRVPAADRAPGRSGRRRRMCGTDRRPDGGAPPACARDRPARDRSSASRSARSCPTSSSGRASIGRSRSAS